MQSTNGSSLVYQFKSSFPIDFSGSSGQANGWGVVFPIHRSHEGVEVVCDDEIAVVFSRSLETVRWLRGGLKSTTPLSPKGSVPISGLGQMVIRRSDLSVTSVPVSPGTIFNVVQKPIGSNFPEGMIKVLKAAGYPIVVISLYERPVTPTPA